LYLKVQAGHLRSSTLCLTNDDESLLPTGKLQIADVP